MTQAYDPSISVRPQTGLERPGRASLDVGRFLAAAFILIYHFSANLPGLGSAGGSGGDHTPLFAGWIATDFFLILSGFVMSRSYLKRLSDGWVSPLGFFARRWFRLWPSHAVVMLAFLAFIGLSLLIGIVPAHADKFRLTGFVEELMLVHGWGFAAEPGWNVPTWTLSALVVCYALFAGLARFVDRSSKPVLAAGLAGLAIIAVFILPILANHGFADLPFRFGLLRAIPLFFAGCLFERLATGLRLAPHAFGRWMAGLLLSLVWLVQLPRQAVTDLLILAVLGGIIATSGAVAFKENALTQRLGRSAYALFLTHSLVGAVWFGLSSHLLDHAHIGAPMECMVWFAGVGAALLTAFVFEAFIDRPLSQWTAVRIVKPSRVSEALG